MSILSNPINNYDFPIIPSENHQFCARNVFTFWCPLQICARNVFTFWCLLQILCTKCLHFLVSAIDFVHEMSTLFGVCYRFCVQNVCTFCVHFIFCVQNVYTFGVHFIFLHKMSMLLVSTLFFVHEMSSLLVSTLYLCTPIIPGKPILHSLLS